MVSSWITFDEVVAARNAVLASVAMAERPQRTHRFIETCDPNQNVQHGLRRNARNCRTADMLNFESVAAHRIDDACLLERVARPRSLGAVQCTGESPNRLENFRFIRKEYVVTCTGKFDDSALLDAGT